VDLFLLALAAAAGWTVKSYFWPMAPCRRCRGRKTNRGSTRKRFGPCGKCGGTGSRFVLGSRAVHRAVRALVAYKKERGKW